MAKFLFTMMPANDLGLPTRLVPIARALADRGHEVHFITYQHPFRLPAFRPRIYFHEVDVGRYPLFEYPPYDAPRLSPTCENNTASMPLK